MTFCHISLALADSLSENTSNVADSKTNMKLLICMSLEDLFYYMIIFISNRV